MRDRSLGNMDKVWIGKTCTNISRKLHFNNMRIFVYFTAVGIECCKIPNFTKKIRYAKI